mmetsp:Transcript_39666/g.60763  ORF Transcript_39666/g.60763 Transcript_39666/m.60763 type:complete len:110 (+) Transcript_39666:7-336(+)|eukprot:CAMPEP_0170489780 /NCGR_PEP_ID=MMETSP0208-20121228/8072_1 /TAXON_ID=197538 /ORGANISM="Strombidium inclinatum, Strain S3" /LENGTH=109 /DNA_ID=CAMNT_0010764851 /DNA_START=6 /DNA_END=335 /DNA_ORIENTATION=-
MINEDGINRVREQLASTPKEPTNIAFPRVTDDDKTRKAGNILYPSFAYAEMVGVFFGANFMYHFNVFRRNRNPGTFIAFMLVNAFTSYNLVEFANPGVQRFYAAAYNNT